MQDFLDTGEPHRDELSRMECEGGISPPQDDNIADQPSFVSPVKLSNEEVPTDDEHTTSPSPTIINILPAPAKRLEKWPISRIQRDPNQPRQEFDERRLNELVNNLKAVGQQCPIIGYLDPKDPAILMLLDGERRLMAARILHLDSLEAVVLPAAPTPAELLLVQLSLGQMREKLTAPEQANAYGKLMSGLKLTQHQLAMKLGVSPTKISNTFCLHRLLPELQAFAGKLEPSIVPIIARLPVALQTSVMMFSTTPSVENGKLPSRDQVQKYIAAQQPTKTIRVKALTGKVEGRCFRIQVSESDNHDSFVAFLKSLMTDVQKHKNVPFSKLGIVLGD